MAISDWHENDRPREKLLKFGSENLTDAELLAILLRVGVQGKSAVELAQDLLDHFGDLHTLLVSSEAEFCSAKGLGPAKFVQFKAVVEIAKRHFESGLSSGVILQSPESVAQFLFTQIGYQKRESFGLVLLDQQHNLISFQALFTGTLNQASVHTREVIKTVLDNHAAAVILAHNHPSGDPTPSQSDIQLTQHLTEALDLVDVRCIDHIIIGDHGRWASLAKKGLI